VRPSGVEQDVERVGVAVADVDDDVGVHDVVDQRDVLVADPLDVVFAEPVPEQRWALEGLGRGDRRAEALLQMVPRRDRSRRPGGRDERVQPEPGLALGQRLEDVRERPAGDHLVHQVVRVLGELVEDRVRRIQLKALALVVDLRRCSRRRAF
jgi:hypothetical protein